MKSLILAEKPSVGKEIGRVLNCSNRKKNYWEGGRYVVTWAMGHLIELAEPVHEGAPGLLHGRNEALDGWPVRFGFGAFCGKGHRCQRDSGDQESGCRPCRLSEGRREIQIGHVLMVLF